MRTVIILFISLMACTFTANAQKYLTKNGHVRFFSHSPMEDIEANNHQVTSILDMESGDIVFSLLMKGFHFEKALMQEHFNEKYVHSDKYPKSTFKGKLPGLSDIDLADGEKHVLDVSGTLTLHGIEQDISVEAQLESKDGQILATCVFPLSLADYDISIPGVVKDNIAKVVEVTVQMNYDPYQK